MNLKIRKAKKSDSKGIIDLVVELAEFEKLTPPDSKVGKKLIYDAFRQRPLFYIIVALDGKKVIGYAFYFFTYSTFLAKPTLFLEDLFVTEKYRSKGVGEKLFNELFKIAKTKKCGRIEFNVLNWNKKAMRFYRRIGAKIMKEWILHRIEI